MPMIFVQLRWNDPGPDRYEEIVRAIPQGGALPPRCLSRQLKRQGAAMLATEAWDDEPPGGRMDDLVMAMRAAGVEDPPQTAMFSVPRMFAVAYRWPAGAAADDAAAAAAAAIPQQRSAPARDQLMETADASATAST
jgi:hypothetical protein